REKPRFMTALKRTVSVWPGMTIPAHAEILIVDVKVFRWPGSEIGTLGPSNVVVYLRTQFSVHPVIWRPVKRVANGKAPTAGMNQIRHGETRLAGFGTDGHARVGSVEKRNTQHSKIRIN